MNLGDGKKVVNLGILKTKDTGFEDKKRCLDALRLCVCVCVYVQYAGAWESHLQAGRGACQARLSCDAPLRGSELVDL